MFGNNDERAQADGPDDNGEVNPLAGQKLDKNNPFYKHPASYTVFSTVTDVRYQGKITALAKELHEYAEQHQTLLRQRLTYEELLHGMLYPGEDLIPVKPMLIRDFIEATITDETVVERCETSSALAQIVEVAGLIVGVKMCRRYGVRMFLTNKRLFFLDADLERIPMLEDHSDTVGGLTLSKLKVTYEVTDDIWYYPVPLTNLKGMSLDIHFATTATGWIAQKRPWWAILWCIAAFGMLAWGIFKLVEKDDTDIVLLIVSGLLSLVGPMIFFIMKVYSRTEFTPKMEQQRQITLGCEPDPCHFVPRYSAKHCSPCRFNAKRPLAAGRQGPNHAAARRLQAFHGGSLSGPSRGV